MGMVRSADVHEGALLCRRRARVRPVRDPVRRNGPDAGALGHDLAVRHPGRCVDCRDGAQGCSSGERAAGPCAAATRLRGDRRGQAAGLFGGRRRRVPLAGHPLQQPDAGAGLAAGGQRDPHRRRFLGCDAGVLHRPSGAAGHALDRPRPCHQGAAAAGGVQRAARCVPGRCVGGEPQVPSAVAAVRCGHRRSVRHVVLRCRAGWCVQGGSVARCFDHGGVAAPALKSQRGGRNAERTGDARMQKPVAAGRPAGVVRLPHRQGRVQAIVLYTSQRPP